MSHHARGLRLRLMIWVLALWTLALTAPTSTPTTTSARAGRGSRVRDDRGDVPGWVLVTVMSAGLVAAIWQVADGQLSAMLTRALSAVQ